MLIRSVKVIILDLEGNILLLRRSDTHPWAPLKSDLPGGLVEDNETFEEGAVRETFEETGLTLNTHTLHLTNTIEEPEHPKGPLVRLFYRAVLNEVKPVIVLSWEHDQYEWRSTQDRADITIQTSTGIDYINRNGLVREVKT